MQQFGHVVANNRVTGVTWLRRSGDNHCGHLVVAAVLNGAYMTDIHQPQRQPVHGANSRATRLTDGLSTAAGPTPTQGCRQQTHGMPNDRTLMAAA